MNTTNTASLLKIGRENKNLTISQLASQTKLSEKRVSDIENNLHPIGEAIPTYIKGQIRLICNILEISSNEVITEITNAGYIFFKEPTCIKPSPTESKNNILSYILEVFASIKAKILDDNTKTGR
jgi:cytoskeletal protein RodZ